MGFQPLVFIHDGDKKCSKFSIVNRHKEGFITYIRSHLFYSNFSRGFINL